jgi:DDE superfamily endonuclease
VALGYGDEVWWSRVRQPPLHTWCEGDLLRLVEQSVSKDDSERKALACYGLYLPHANQMALRFVADRPISDVTCQYLDWITTQQAARRKRALILIWDNASWHTSQRVRQWIQQHNQQVKREGGCRLLVFYLPSKSPWLNAIEPKWVHGKRAVVEPNRLLTSAELMQRVCHYYQCELLDPLAKSVC